MEGRLAVELTDSCKNPTPETEEEVFRKVFAEEKEEKLERIKMMVEVELIERDLKEQS